MPGCLLGSRWAWSGTWALQTLCLCFLTTQHQPQHIPHQQLAHVLHEPQAKYLLEVGTRYDLHSAAFPLKCLLQNKTLLIRSALKITGCNRSSCLYGRIITCHCCLWSVREQEEWSPCSENGEVPPAPPVWWTFLWQQTQDAWSCFLHKSSFCHLSVKSGHQEIWTMSVVLQGRPWNYVELWGRLAPCPSANSTRVLQRPQSRPQAPSKQLKLSNEAQRWPEQGTEKTSSMWTLKRGFRWKPQRKWQKREEIKV